MNTEADWKVQAEYPGFMGRLYASILDTALLIWPISIVGDYFINALLGTDRFAERQNFLAEHLDAESLEAFREAFAASGISGPMWTEIVLSLTFVILPVIFCWVKYSVTPGKFLARMRIVDADTGQRMSVKQSLVRYLGYFVSTFMFLGGFFWIAFDKRKQGWHDKMANTVVVYTHSLPEKAGKANV